MFIDAIIVIKKDLMFIDAIIVIKKDLMFIDAIIVIKKGDSKCTKTRNQN